MVDTVTSKTLVSGNNIHVVQLTNNSDGTGETNVVKVDRSALTGPAGTAPLKLRIDSLQFSIQGFEGVKLSWDDTDGGSDETAVILSGQGYYDYKEFGGLNPKDAASSGATGDLLLSTTGTPASGDTYDITIRLRLKQ